MADIGHDPAGHLELRPRTGQLLRVVPARARSAPWPHQDSRARRGERPRSCRSLSWRSTFSCPPYTVSAVCRPPAVAADFNLLPCQGLDGDLLHASSVPSPYRGRLAGSAGWQAVSYGLMLGACRSSRSVVAWCDDRCFLAARCSPSEDGTGGGEQSPGTQRPACRPG